MKLPSDETLYHLMLFILFGAVVIGILFDTNYG